MGWRDDLDRILDPSYLGDVESRSIDELRRMAVKQGMRTLNDEAIALVEQDLTTIPEVIRHIYTG